MISFLIYLNELHPTQSKTKPNKKLLQNFERTYILQPSCRIKANITK
jgi:hypothetical protein